MFLLGLFSLFLKNFGRNDKYNKILYKMVVAII